MLVVLPPIFVADTKIAFVYNLAVPLTIRLTYFDKFQRN